MSFAEYYQGFSGLGKSFFDGMDSARQQRERDEYKANLAKLGDAAGSGDYEGAAKAAFGLGDINSGLGLLKYRQAIEQSKANAAAFGGLAGLYAPGAGGGADGGAQPPVGGVYGYPRAGAQGVQGGQGASLPPLASARPPIFARPDLGASDGPGAIRTDRSVPMMAQGPLWAQSIKDIESSGGNYGALGPRTRTGDRAYGAYQVMGANVGPWTQEVLGRRLSPDEFLADRDAQDRVFQTKFGQSVARYGNPQDAASVWFTGKPLSQGAGSRDVLGTTGRGYVDRFTAGLQRGGGQPQQVASADPNFLPAPLPPNGRTSVPMSLPPGASEPTPGMSPKGVPLPPPRSADLSAELAPDSPPMQVAQAAPPLQAPPLLSQAGAPPAPFPGAAPAPQAPSADLPAPGSQDAGFTIPPAARAQLSAQAPQHLVQAGVPQQMAAPVANMAPGSAQKIQYLLRLGTMPGMDEGQRSTIGTLLRNELEQTKLPDAVKQYMFAKSSAGGGFDGSFSDFQNKKGDEGDKITAQLKAREQWLIAHDMDPREAGNQSWLMGGKSTTGHVLKPGDILAGAGGQTLARNEGAGAGGMPDQTANFLAERVLAGDTKALIGLGRGAQGAENLSKIQGLVAQKAVERGLDATDVLQAAADASGMGAQARTLGTQAGRMSAAATEAEGAIALARTASAAVPRGSFVPLNRLSQAIQSNTGDPSLRAFSAANNTLVNTFARAVSPTGVGTVSDKEHAREMLSTADSPEAYEAVLKQMQAEIDMAHKAPQRARTILEQERQAAKGGAAAPQPQPAPQQPVPQPGPTFREGQTATNPKTGAKAVFRGGQWVPVEAPPPRVGGVL